MVTAYTLYLTGAWGPNDSTPASSRTEQHSYVFYINKHAVICITVARFSKKPLEKKTAVFS